MTIGPLDRLTDILRERYQTGAHGGTYLEMSRATMEAMPRPAPTRPSYLPPDPLDALLSIPVVLANGMPLYEWRLRDVSTGAQVEYGRWQP